MAGIMTDTTVLATPSVTIESVVRKIREISTLPHAALRVIEVAKDPNAGAAELKTAVESDPALCSRVLRSVNSAGNALRRKITNVHEAVSFLGFSQIRNLALTASVATIFKKDDEIGTYRRTALWRHMVSVGVCARLIARRKGLSNFEDAFLAGLVHDIGIILEDEHVHPQFCKVIRGLTDRSVLKDAERKNIGFDHTTLGEQTAQAWKFPPIVRAAIRYHHNSHEYRGENAAIVHSVELANVICTLKGITSVGRKLVRLPKEALVALEFGKEDILVLAEDLDQEFTQNECLFEV